MFDSGSWFRLHLKALVVIPLPGRDHVPNLFVGAIGTPFMAATSEAMAYNSYSIGG